MKNIWVLGLLLCSMGYSRAMDMSEIDRLNDSVREKRKLLISQRASLKDHISSVGGSTLADRQWMKKIYVHAFLEERLSVLMDDYAMIPSITTQEQLNEITKKYRVQFNTLLAVEKELPKYVNEVLPD